MSEPLPQTLTVWVEVIHPAALAMPRLDAAQYAALKSSIARHGLLVPLGIFVDGRGEHWLLDGVSRLQALVELGLPTLDSEGRWAMLTTNYHAGLGIDPFVLARELNSPRLQRHALDVALDRIARLERLLGKLNARVVSVGQKIGWNFAKDEELDGEE